MQSKILRPSDYCTLLLGTTQNEELTACDRRKREILRTSLKRLGLSGRMRAQGESPSYDTDGMVRRLDVRSQVCGGIPSTRRATILVHRMVTDDGRCIFSNFLVSQPSKVVTCSKHPTSYRGLHIFAVINSSVDACFRI